MNVGLQLKLAAYGTTQHEYAHREIEAGRLSDLVGTVGLYINDAIRYRMTCEQVLYYSENCFGTADTIAFRYNTLRIHDLKTGVIQVQFINLKFMLHCFVLSMIMIHSISRLNFAFIKIMKL